MNVNLYCTSGWVNRFYLLKSSQVSTLSIMRMIHKLPVFSLLFIAVLHSSPYIVHKLCCSHDVLTQFHQGKKVNSMEKWRYITISWGHNCSHFSVSVIAEFHIDFPQFFAYLKLYQNILASTKIYTMYTMGRDDELKTTVNNWRNTELAAAEYDM